MIRHSTAPWSNWSRRSKTAGFLTSDQVATGEHLNDPGITDTSQTVSVYMDEALFAVVSATFPRIWIILPRIEHPLGLFITGRLYFIDRQVVRTGFPSR
ncbi:MAG: hypothetical protein O3A63_12950 [Proteobacteria bacterium]|nr:hypothetical protein [Pseudomonadota bacterium]